MFIPSLGKGFKHNSDHKRPEDSHHRIAINPSLLSALARNGHHILVMKPIEAETFKLRAKLCSISLQ